MGERVRGETMGGESARGETWDELRRKSADGVDRVAEEDEDVSDGQRSVVRDGRTRGHSECNIEALLRPLHHLSVT